MRNGRRGRMWAAAAVAALLLLAVPVAVSALRPEVPAAQETVRIAIPYNKYVYQPDNSYYTLWLEEQTGLDIEFVMMEETVTDDYLRILFSTDIEELDAIFLAPGESASPGSAVLRELGHQGAILPLNDYIDAQGTHTRALFETFEAYDLRAALADEDGRIYWLPNVSTAEHTQVGQTMWINVGWLRNLGLQLPQTTEAFRQVMRAFATEDPNGNGLADEVAIASCADNETYAAQHFLINAFVYDDPATAHLAVAQGEVSFAPATGEWREALAYLNGLYEEGLLPQQSFTYTTKQLEQLVNDPRDLVGCFVSDSISDLVRIHSPDILNRFVHLSPLLGPSGAAYAQAPTPKVYPGGLISGQCQNPQAVFALMDLMLSPEAALIAHFGEQDVDWKYAAAVDVGITGQKAHLHVRNNLTAGLHNQNLAQAGPCYLSDSAVDEVMWGGPLMEQMFMDGRAVSAYKGSYPAEYMPALLFPPGRQDELQAAGQRITEYTAEALEAFVTGAWDIGDDAAWGRYLRQFDTLGLPEFLAAYGA